MRLSKEKEEGKLTSEQAALICFCMEICYAFQWATVYSESRIFFGDSTLSESASLLLAM
jgi:hypothetical protein